MTPVPDLSVVMSVYNGAEALPTTLASILSQQSVDFELIVVDDGSTDDSASILDEAAAGDGRIRVVHQPNSGLTRALICGCSKARGEFIARQDCGDVSLPGRLAQQRDAIRGDGALSFVSSWTRFATLDAEALHIAKGSGRATRPIDVIDATQPYGVLDGPAHHGSVMFRRSAYENSGGYRPEFYYGQDWDLWYRLAERGKFQMLQAFLYEARIGVNDISMNNKARQELIGQQSFRALQLRQAGLSDQPALDEAMKIRPGAHNSRRRGGVSQGCYFMGECLRRNGNRAAALRYLKRAVQENPLHLKSWVRLLQTRFG